MAAIEAQVPEVAAYNLDGHRREGLKMLDGRLADSPFIACRPGDHRRHPGGDGLDFARMIRFRPDAELAHVRRWLEA
jgi:hypothetical protein